MRRSRPALKLGNSPLVLVVAQVRISPVLQMETYVPAIQERLRKIGFPRFSEARIQEIAFGPAPSMVTRNKWAFADQDRKVAVVLAQEFITLETAAYDTFDAFSAQFGSVLAPISEVVDIALSERIGLRYVDHIRPQPDDHLTEYLADGLAGLNAVGAAVGLQGSVYLAQGSTNVGQYTFRLTRSEGPFVLPPDLLPNDVEVSPRESAAEHAVLDLDHFVSAGQPFEPTDLLETFWELHDVVDGLFRSAITDHALQVWQAESAEDGS